MDQIQARPEAESDREARQKAHQERRDRTIQAAADQLGVSREKALELLQREEPGF